jgi:hypothetical protein
VKRARDVRPAPPAPNPKTATTVASRHISTVPRHLPPPRKKSPKPAARVASPRPAFRAPKSTGPARRVARIIDQDESTLLDLVDNLLSKGVVINADLILALANVDLVYVRLSALLCAADRIFASNEQRTASRGRGLPSHRSPDSGKSRTEPRRSRGGGGGA